MGIILLTITYNGGPLKPKNRQLFSSLCLFLMGRCVNMNARRSIRLSFIFKRLKREPPFWNLVNLQEIHQISSDFLLPSAMDGLWSGGTWTRCSWDSSRGSAPGWEYLGPWWSRQVGRRRNHQGRWVGPEATRPARTRHSKHLQKEKKNMKKKRFSPTNSLSTSRLLRAMILMWSVCLDHLKIVFKLRNNQVFTLARNLCKRWEKAKINKKAASTQSSLLIPPIKVVIGKHRKREIKR